MSKPEIIYKQPQGDTFPIPIILLHGAWHGAWCLELLASFLEISGFQCRILSFRDHESDREDKKKWIWCFELLTYLLVSLGFQCRALSFRNHEGSRKDKKKRIWASLKDYVEDVERAVAHIDAGVPPIILGHSMGGLIAQMYAQKHPVSALVLLCSIPSSGSFGTIWKFAKKYPWITAKFFLTMSLYHAIKKLSVVRELLFSSSVGENIVQWWQERLQNESFWAYLLAFIPQKFSSKRMHKPTPVLVFHAQKDQLVSLKQSAQTAQSYGADLEILSAMAHCDMLAIPEMAKLVARIIAQWIRNQNILLPS